MTRILPYNKIYLDAHIYKNNIGDELAYFSNHKQRIY